MALLAHGERKMNTKRLAALVTLGALLSTAAPAMAVTQTGTVNVEWNYAITATLTMYTQTTESGSHGPAASSAPAANDIFTQANGGAGQCNGSAGASKDTYPSGSGTVDFGLVVADAADYTNCLEINAIDAYFITNDSKGADITVQATSGAPSAYDTATNGSLLCIEPNGAWSTTGNTAWTASARAAAIAMSSTVACSAGTLVSASAAVPLLTQTAGPDTGSDLNQDIQLNMGPQMQSGAQTVVLTYTLTTN